jgi:hypothetical protein
MPVIGDETIKWISLLASALTLTLLGTTFPNRFNQQRNPRPHNGLRLFNECLARCQLALFNYFLAFAITADLGVHSKIRPVLVFLAMISTYSYVAHVGASVDLDKKLAATHSCPGTLACGKKIGLWEFTKVSARYVVSTGALVVIALVYAFLAGGSGTPSKP